MRACPLTSPCCVGINVGGRNRVAMADLREVVTSLGHTEVTTYVQSGNVVFTSPDADTGALAAALEQRIGERLSVRPRLVVLSRAELAAVVAANPFPDETNPKCLHALFRGTEFGPDEARAVAAAQQRAAQLGSPDEAPRGRAHVVPAPDGLGRSELAAQLARTGADTTARNWATVTKLLARLDA